MKIHEYKCRKCGKVMGGCSKEAAEDPNCIIKVTCLNCNEVHNLKEEKPEIREEESLEHYTKKRQKEEKKTH